jgi:hypothetical protein
VQEEDVHDLAQRSLGVFAISVSNALASVLNRVSQHDTKENQW